MTADKVYLVGFMGAGKTSVARALAKRLGWEMLDVDVQIEQREHQTVSEIFAKRGEPYFRTLERAVLGDQIGQRHLVVATGGGTFADAENRAAINLDGVSVWIDLPLADLIPRIPLDGRRPLASDRAQLERLYAARVEAYRSALLRVGASHMSTSRIVDYVLEAIHHLPSVVHQPTPPV